MAAAETTGKAGRPREFDIGVALGVALDVFWRQGYEGTNMAELAAAMGINRPSLYAAFGNKEQLFRAATARYAGMIDEGIAAALSEPTARRAAERVLRETAEALTVPGRDPTGCFLVVSALCVGPASRGVRDEVGRRRATWAPALRQRFERAAAAGELPDGRAEDLAAYFAMVLEGLSVQAVNGVTREQLYRLIDVALQVWPGS